jgi:hypothetical protein
VLGLVGDDTASVNGRSVVDSCPEISGKFPLGTVTQDCVTDVPGSPLCGASVRVQLSCHVGPSGPITSRSTVALVMKDPAGSDKLATVTGESSVGSDTPGEVVENPAGSGPDAAAAPDEPSRPCAPVAP